ncbi:hypothetical protein AB0F91_35835 [Amycolatopsis sp. NPDC023774]|uniref:hypothetical protein n=1 Tax=Amycolatopsis sp. NPDC023774 TaxID=3155015 RepID=UPI0034062AF6
MPEAPIEQSSNMIARSRSCTNDLPTVVASSAFNPWSRKIAGGHFHFAEGRDLDDVFDVVEPE